MISTKLASRTPLTSQSERTPPLADTQASPSSSNDFQEQHALGCGLPPLPARSQVDGSHSDIGTQAPRLAVLPPTGSNSETQRVAEASTLSRASSASTLSANMGSVDSASGSSARRAELLGDYQAATHRPLDMQRAVAAIKLRRAAEIYCDKNNFARLTPRLPRTVVSRERFAALLAKPVDELIAEVQANPKRFSRTQLTDLAQRHLLAALNIDVKQYNKGVHNAALYEGLHSVAGRLVSVAAAGISAGVSEIPGVKTGTSAAMKGIKKGVKILAHELPPNVINPALTGGLRSITDVKEAFKRVGGLPVVTQKIDKSPTMGIIADTAKEKRQQLDDAIAHFKSFNASDPQALGRLVDAFMALHDIADRQYRRRIGLNRTQTYSKGWGMAVNGVAATGAVVTATVPVVGQIAGPAILGATVPLQWAAGYLDERRNKHRYNLRANTKWGDFLKEDAARIHFTDLKPEHILEASLRRSFMTQPEVQVAAIREVYEDALGELMRQHAELEKKIGVQQQAGTPARALAPQREQLWDLENRIDVAKQQASHFESFDIERWRSIPADSLIGRCLDNLGELEKANRQARLRKPGEGAQIVQRYVQALHGGMSTGLALPIVDGITASDGLYTHDAHGHAVGLQPVPEALAVSAGVAGGAVFTAATGEVRMSKADNKKLMSQLRVTPETYAAHRDQWTFQAGDRNVDLRTSAGYRKHVHTTRDELAQVAKAVGHGISSGPVGVWNMLCAKTESRHARASLRTALDALNNADLQRNTPSGKRASTIAAMKDELYDYPAVRQHLGVNAATEA